MVLTKVMIAKEINLETLELGAHKSDTDLYFKTVYQCYLWDVKERYRVPYAGNGKYWRKCIVKMANMW